MRPKVDMSVPAWWHTIPSSLHEPFIELATMCLQGALQLQASAELPVSTAPRMSKDSCRLDTDDALSTATSDLTFGSPSPYTRRVLFAVQFPVQQDVVT